ncbi:hypothetical protein [Salinicoccus sp. HZC-1]|uniref:hypothetical protein n=1 Tax=Salinicoccus sp. HZC-1 TaxID=3385497 RepID=UPI00398B1C42
MTISKNNSFRHYLIVFLLFIGVFAAGSGIVNLMTTNTISIGEILAMIGLLAAAALYMRSRVKIKKSERNRK